MERVWRSLFFEKQCLGFRIGMDKRAGASAL
jgi:hypothetical protein